MKSSRGWSPIDEDTPKDRIIELYVPAEDELQALIILCKYHPDAGFTVDALREATHWREHVPPPKYNKPPEASKLCVDCKFYSLRSDQTKWNRERHGCVYISEDYIVDVVTGEKNRKTLYDFCHNARRSNGYCGPEGKLWSKRND